MWVTTNTDFVAQPKQKKRIERLQAAREPKNVALKIMLSIDSAEASGISLGMLMLKYFTPSISPIIANARSAAEAGKGISIRLQNCVMK